MIKLIQRTLKFPARLSVLYAVLFVWLSFVIQVYIVMIDVFIPDHLLKNSGFLKNTF